MADTVSYGAPNGVKFVRTTTGAPSGPPTGFPAYRVGDCATADDGTDWVCTVAGSPGTWVQIGTGAITGNASITGTLTVTSANSKATAVGPTGATNPVFAIDGSVASQADGVSVAGNAAGSGTTFTGTSSGSDSPFRFQPKGAGGTSFGVAAANSTFTVAPNNTITGATNNQIATTSASSVINETLTGADAAVGRQFTQKGTGGVAFGVAPAASTFTIAPNSTITGATNNQDAITSVSGLITHTATGGDPTVGWNFVPKSTGTFQVGGVINSLYETVTYLQPVGTAAATWAVTAPFYTFPNDGTTWKVIQAAVRWSTASSSGTVAITLDSAGGAPGSGTSQQSAPQSTAGSANTTANVTANVGTTCSAGQSLSAVWAGTVTGLVGCVITVTLQRLS